MDGRNKANEQRENGGGSEAFEGSALQRFMSTRARIDPNLDLTKHHLKPEYEGRPQLW